MKVPVTIFSGFLGAGKTTLIGNLLKQCQDGRSAIAGKFAIIVNELGTTSIDGALLSRDACGCLEVDVINVTGAPIAYDGDKYCEGLLKQLAGRGSEFDHVIVETSGLAVPTAIIGALSAADYAGVFSLDAVITVIDTPEILRDAPLYKAAAETLRQQVDAADIVVLNKIDALTGCELCSAEAKIREQSPRVRFIELAHHAVLDQRLVLGLHLHTARKVPQGAGCAAAMPAGAASSVGADGHSHEGWMPHDHGLRTHEHLHEHDPGWISFSLHTSQLQDPQLVTAAVKRVIAAEPLLRAKGFLAGSGGQFFELQCVRDRVAVTSSNKVVASVVAYNAQRSEIVFIGYNLAREHVAGHMKTVTGTPWH